MTFSERYYAAFSKVLESDDFNLVNQYIGAEGKDGDNWEIIKVDTVDKIVAFEEREGGPQLKRTLVYVIGRVKKEAPKSTGAPVSTASATTGTKTPPAGSSTTVPSAVRPSTPTPPQTPAQNPPTVKQINALRAWKVPQSEIDTMTFPMASKKIGELIEAKNKRASQA